MTVIPNAAHAAVPHASGWDSRVALVAKPGGSHTGVGRYVDTLDRWLLQAEFDTTRVAPVVPPIPEVCYSVCRRRGADLRTFLINYPIWAQYPQATVYHFTAQNLASLLLFRRPTGKVVVTIHDIIPYMLRDDPQLTCYRTPADRFFDHLAMRGLRKADSLIAVSHYTKQRVIEHLGIAAERIQVVHSGIDHDRFRPLPGVPALHDRYRLPEGRRYLIYVGSEDPRKGLVTLIRALAEVRRALPNVALIKVGRAHFDGERGRLSELAIELDVRPAIHFLDDVSEDDLPLLYNLADVCVVPSLYEGFGFPALEAQACGTPVVCANAASLPELVGNAALLFDHGSDAVKALSASLVRLLTEQDLYQALRAQGLVHAAGFQWDQTARHTIEVYRAVAGPQGGS